MTQTMAAVGAQSKAQDIAYRRCWWRHGHRNCRWYDAPYRGYGYYPNRGDGYYYGPSFRRPIPSVRAAGGRKMDREDRGGRGSRR
jgi:hypothetical protein